ncbi:MAG: hypothetical protein AB1772_00900 [Candidatus Zixiibacteriota bacterium]
MTPARFRWGMLFILVGTLLLLVNADVLNCNFWIDFVYLLPFLLIAIGLEKIFAPTRLRAISYLTTVALVVGALWVAFEGSAVREGGSFFESMTLTYDEDEELVDLIDADLELGATSLTIRDAGDELMTARFGEWSRKPMSSMEVLDRRAVIDLNNRTGSRRYWGGAVQIDTDQSEDWRVSFSRSVPLKLSVSGEDSELHLNLATTPLKELDLRADDADIYIKLGDLQPEVRVKVSGDDSKLRVRVPQESGLRVTGVDDPSYLEQIGLVMREGSYVSDGFDTSAVRIQIELDDRFRSLSLDFY